MILELAMNFSLTEVFERLAVFPVATTIAPSFRYFTTGVVYVFCAHFPLM
jgi:hypothetical protein